MLVKVIDTRTAFANFEVVANASGLLVTPRGSLRFRRFPSVHPTDAQQVGDGIWGIHTADVGNGSCGGSLYDDYEHFLARVTRSGANDPNIGDYDYEIRFTGSNSNPGVNGVMPLSISMITMSTGCRLKSGEQEKGPGRPE